MSTYIGKQILNKGYTLLQLIDTSADVHLTRLCPIDTKTSSIIIKVMYYCEH